MVGGRVGLDGLDGWDGFLEVGMAILNKSLGVVGGGEAAVLVFGPFRDCESRVSGGEVRLWSTSSSGDAIRAGYLGVYVVSEGSGRPVLADLAGGRGETTGDSMAGISVVRGYVADGETGRIKFSVSSFGRYVYVVYFNESAVGIAGSVRLYKE